MVYVRAICLSSWVLLWGGRVGGGQITLFPRVHCFTLWKFQKMPKEQLILHWSQQGAINSLRQAGLHSSYLLPVELSASLRGEGGKLPFSLGCTTSLFESFRKCLKNNSYHTGPNGVQLILSDKLDYRRAICCLLSWVLLWDIDLVLTILI